MLLYTMVCYTYTSKSSDQRTCAIDALVDYNLLCIYGWVLRLENFCHRCVCRLWFAIYLLAIPQTRNHVPWIYIYNWVLRLENTVRSMNSAGPVSGPSTTWRVFGHTKSRTKSLHVLTISKCRETWSIWYFHINSYTIIFGILAVLNKTRTNCP